MRWALVIVMAGASLMGQQRNTTSPTGFGRILFPGGTPPAGSAGAASPYGRIIYPGTGAPAVTRSVRGNPAPPATHPGHSGSALIPYPVFWPTGNFLQYDPPQAPVVGTPGYQSDAPVVIVNQYFRPDEPVPVQAPAARAVVVQEARVTAENQDKETIFLIAMKDHTIYAASAYWVEDGTLNYVTIQGSQNSASMDLVDRELSARLNRDRKVAFGLPVN
jgi:hypothetical protein